MNELIGALLRLLNRTRSRRNNVVESYFQVRLPSRLREACFQATITMVWREGYADSGSKTHTERRVLQTARAVAEKFSVLDRDDARAEIHYVLSNSPELLQAHVPLIGASVRLEAGQADRELAEKQEALNRELALDRAQQQHMLDRLRFLGELVLTDPRLIRLWWLDGRRDKLSELVHLNSMFEDVNALFTGQADRPGSETIADLIRQFLQDLGPGQRAYLIDQIRFIFTAYEHGDLADKLPSVLRPAARRPGDTGMMTA